MARVREAGTSLIPTASLGGHEVDATGHPSRHGVDSPGQTSHKLFFGGQFGDSLDLVFRQVPDLP